MPPRKPKDDLQAAVDALPLKVVEPEPEEPEADGPLDPISALVQAAAIGLPWAEMRNGLKDVITSVANGTVKASAAQVAMLKHIISEAKEDAKGDEFVLGVVLLPTQGEAAGLRLSKAAKKRAMDAIAEQK